MLKFIYSPLLHFLMIGLFIFVVAGMDGDSHQHMVEPISSEEIAQLAAEWQLQQGQVADKKILAALMQEQLLERVMVAEAIARGFHLQDSVVRQRLLLNMQFIESEVMQGDEQYHIDQAIALGMVESDLVVRRRMVQLLEQNLMLGEVVMFSDRQIEQYYDQHKSSFIKETKIALEHVFFAADNGGTEVAFQRSQAAIKALSGGNVAGALNGEMFIHGQHLPLQTERQYRRIFGGDFSRAIQSLTLSQWSGPIASSFGWHVVKLKERSVEQPKPLSEVAAEIVVILQEQWQQQRLYHKQQALLQHYAHPR
ncbi:peptidylprolyl isomerase [Sinobacterium norvegicum]|uniref:peptidylprolyl isomerase n=1 Tax=Sinobacterium norvegicum TaxID=1641715 RepID=UPI001F003FB4|nr:peptidyl-prolyl cis-trans isomerase [Sinobacterium norvegicum]